VPDLGGISGKGERNKEIFPLCDEQQRRRAIMETISRRTEFLLSFGRKLRGTMDAMVREAKGASSKHKSISEAKEICTTTKKGEKQNHDHQFVKRHVPNLRNRENVSP